MVSGYPTSTNIPRVDGLSTVNDYLGSSVGVFISMVLIPASQLGIKAKVNDYLGSSVGVFINMVLIPASQLGIREYVYEYLGLDGHG